MIWVYTAILTLAPGDLAETLPVWLTSDRRKNIVGQSVVAECLADVNKAIDIPRSEHKAASELKRVFPQAMLAMSSGLGAFAVGRIVLAQNVKQGSFAERNRAVGLAFIIDQQRKGDLRVLAEVLGIRDVAEPYRHQTGAFLTKILFMFAQLRDVLAAENSAVVAKKNNHCRGLRPKRPKAGGMAIDVGQRDSRQFAAERLCHAAHSQVC